MPAAKKTIHKELIEVRRKTIHEKLIEARKEFHSNEIKKTGWNDYSKYHYFEFSDFAVPAMDILAEQGLIAIISFETELATMTVTDVKTGEFITITSPMSEAKLKACQPVQSMGACQSFVSRYLYTTLFQIVEHEAIEMQTGAPEQHDTRKPEPAKQAKLATEEQFAEINDFVSENCIPVRTLEWLKNEKNWNGLTSSQATKILAVCRKHKKDTEND